MARQLRLDVPNILYHVINRGNGRQVIFRSHRDFNTYLKLIERYKEKYPIKLYNYVFMPNHVHFLLEPLEQGVLARFMHDLTLAHTTRFNFARKSVGHVWQGRYKNIPIESDEYFFQCGRYIELNPVRAHLVNHPTEYAWSSYHTYAKGASNSIVDFHPLYESFDINTELRQRRYQEFVESEIEPSMEGKAKRFSCEQIYGEKTFVKHLEQHGFTLLRSRIGRPKKGT